MDLSTLLLVIISRLDGERTIYAGLHLLRGKRSGQTLQDVEYYNLKAFFGILSKLQIELFDEAAEQLKKSAYISINESKIVYLTKEGRQAVASSPTYHFNGWDYRGREHIFFARLSLVVQTISNFKSGEKSFIPTQKDLEVQQFVKKVLYRQPIERRDFSRQIQMELSHLIEQSGMNDIQKIIFTHRLGGHGYTGWTWTQLAGQLQLTSFSVHLLFIESLHLLLVAIESSTDVLFLRKMTENVKVSSYLTDSSIKTKTLFDKGMSMGDIAATRRLKMSTIEDHFVEMSINDVGFPIEQFVSKFDMECVMLKANELGTKRLRLLKDAFSHLTYFQLRLILGSQSRGEIVWTSK